MNWTYWKYGLIATAMWLLSVPAMGQSTLEAERNAQMMLNNKEYDKALPLLKELYVSAPFDKRFYDNYLSALLQTKNYDTAIALGQYMSRIRREDLSILVDIGNAFELKGDAKSARQYYEQSLTMLNGNEFQATGLVGAFRFYKNADYELKTMEAFRDKVRNPYIFSYELALLYDQKGETDKAVTLLLESIAAQPFSIENAKNSIDRIIQGNPKKVKKFETALSKKLNQESNNYLWKELYTWLQSGKGDKSEQLKEMIQLDENQQRQGGLVMNWAKEQYQKEEHELALQGVRYVIQLGKISPSYMQARQLYLIIMQEKLEHSYPINTAMLQQLQQDYSSFIQEYPQYRNNDLVLDYTGNMALYAHQPEAAIDTLEHMLEQPYLAPDLQGKMKLALGDYNILTGKIWDAALLYAQVDKTFKEDYLGEEARFRNAKLSYYRGDFDYAQGQLSVLKASTSELIANDALYLSVLITENTPEDKDFTVLKRFAKADLLLFQHKYDEADGLLDSIAKAYPDNDLQDDIAMQRAKIAMKKQDYYKAIDYLRIIQDKYSDDVLGDDATMKLAEIFEEQIKDKGKAREQYEHLITTYPGSTYIQQARTRYDALKGDTP
ncbi:tetratricopeptide repeat protein [Edaphocola flava]|uniref:tetratricopeptide repeat protein n=1 Tax=Edaphocola flava TaxID=2499629 RepID=UPI00100AE61F|nr:tetratricopeptide repeat protein [Edaphocola flava]